MELEIHALIDNDNKLIPFVNDGVRAGFPSPAQDYIVESIDLNKELIQHPSTTFCAKVVGDSMIEANVYDGDILIVDRSLEPHTGDMAVCFLNGEFTLKYICVEDNEVFLQPANPNYPRIKVEEESSFRIWGIVTFSIHKH